MIIYLFRYKIYSYWNYNRITNEGILCCSNSASRQEQCVLKILTLLIVRNCPFDQVKSWNIIVSKYLTNDVIFWPCIPACSPRSESMWEENIKLMEIHLTTIIGRTLLSLKQIESILHSWSLLSITDNSNDLETLTPANFWIVLKLKSLADASSPEYGKVTWLDFNIYKVFRTTICKDGQSNTTITSEHSFIQPLKYKRYLVIGLLITVYLAPWWSFPFTKFGVD